MEASIEDAMQQWLNSAQQSDDARDRIAVANGISRGVFGSLHLGSALSEFDERHADTYQEEFKRVA